MVDLHDVQISVAEENDCEILTHVAFAAKKHWQYPPRYYDIWKDELTITMSYIQGNRVYKAHYHNKILGFYSIVENSADFWSGEVLVNKGFWLEHLFIDPLYHKMGIGQLMMSHALSIARANGIQSILVFVDPYARGFYDKIGANFIRMSKSSIPKRMIPVYEMEVK